MIDEMIEEGARRAPRGGLGMAHRGRLNVLAHTVGRPYEAIIAEFEGEQSMDVDTAMPEGGTGDVKYHYGAAGTYRTKGGKGVTVTLSPNPSHLEFINPVVEGRARADQTSRKARDPVHEPSSVVPLLLHGDAARAGCRRGDAQPAGALRLLHRRHDPHHHEQPARVHDRPERRALDALRVDLAKGYDLPVIHVNADDVEACVHAVRLAMGFRREFRRDAVIDLIGYRRFGHNETDEPGYTQPLMYDKIKQHPPVRKIYAQKLIGEGLVTEEEAEALATEAYQELADAHAELRQAMTQGPDTGEFEIDTGPSKEPRTAVPAETLRVAQRAAAACAVRLQRAPQAQAAARAPARDHRRGRRDRLGAGGGARVRVAARAGHADPPHRPGHRARHVQPAPPVAARHEDGREVHAVQNLKSATAPFELHNSPLSEIACLGFEYGYSVQARRSSCGRRSSATSSTRRRS